MYEEKPLKIIEDVNFFKNYELSKFAFQSNFYFVGSIYERIHLFYGIYEDEDIYQFVLGDGEPYNGYVYFNYGSDCFGSKYLHRYSKEVVGYQYYVEGTAIGLDVDFYLNGNLKEIRNTISYGDPDFIIREYFGPHFKWYGNGALKQEGYYMTRYSGKYYADKYRSYDERCMQEQKDSEVLYRKYDMRGKLLASKTELTQEEKKDIDATKKLIPSMKGSVLGSDDFYNYFEKNNLDPDLKNPYDKNTAAYNEYEYRKRGLEMMKRVEVPYIESLKKALAAGAEVRNHIPDFMPENMNPLNGVRKPLMSN